VNVSLTLLLDVAMVPWNVSVKVSVPTGEGTVCVTLKLKVVLTLSIPDAGPVTVKDPNCALVGNGGLTVAPTRSL
jgi:hypothetical protein